MVSHGLVLGPAAVSKRSDIARAPEALARGARTSGLIAIWGAIRASSRHRHMTIWKSRAMQPGSCLAPFCMARAAGDQGSSLRAKAVRLRSHSSSVADDRAAADIGEDHPVAAAVANTGNISSAATWRRAAGGV